MVLVVRSTWVWWFAVHGFANRIWSWVGWVSLYLLFMVVEGFRGGEDG